MASDAPFRSLLPSRSSPPNGPAHTRGAVLFSNARTRRPSGDTARGSAGGVLRENGGLGSVLRVSKVGSPLSRRSAGLGWDIRWKAPLDHAVLEAVYAVA